MTRRRGDSASFLVVGLTGASLVGMTHNFTRATAPQTPGAGVSDPGAGHPFLEQLVAHGVPEEMHERFAAHGVGTLVEKLGIVFREISVERVVACRDRLHQCLQFFLQGIRRQDND